MSGILRANFTENIKFSCSNMCNGNIRYFLQALDYEFGLMRFSRNIPT